MSDDTQRRAAPRHGRVPRGTLKTMLRRIGQPRAHKVALLVEREGGRTTFHPPIELERLTNALAFDSESEHWRPLSDMAERWSAVMAIATPHRPGGRKKRRAW